MKQPRRQPTQRWLAGATAALATLAASDRLLAAHWSGFSKSPVAQPDAHGRFGFSYDGVLGTSLDVRLDALSEGDARECERQMLAEIDRLEKILSTYHPASEISRVRAGAPVKSLELAEVIEAYDVWSARTGALSGNLAAVISLWQQAQVTGRRPAARALADAFATPLALNIDALGKGYIVDRTVAVARRIVPAGMVNIGGDIRVWGDTAWMVGVADPRHPADNAAPLLQFPLREAAVATSAGYARYYTIGGQRTSHLIDPRTLRPVDPGASATLVAGDCLTANALSTAAAVLGPAEGAALARAHAFDHLIVGGADRSDAVVGSGATAASVPTRVPAATGPAAPVGANDTWPAGFQVAVTVALKSPGGFRAKRPYVAVWVESRDQKVVRTLTIWGRKDRYLPELTKWWRATGGDRSIIQTVSRATRQPGIYTLAWDGRDESGHPVPAGEYKIWTEINREHGHHVYESASLMCGTEPGAVELRATAESDAGQIEYGPKGR